MIRPKGIIVLVVLNVVIMTMGIVLIDILSEILSGLIIIWMTSPLFCYGLWYGDKRLYRWYYIFLYIQIAYIVIISILYWKIDKTTITGIVGNGIIIQYLDKPHVRDYFKIPKKI